MELILYEPADDKNFKVLGFGVNERASFLKTVLQFGIGGKFKCPNKIK